MRIHAIVRTEVLLDAREHAMLPLLAATGLLRGFVDPAERRPAARIAEDLRRGDALQSAVARSIAVIEAGEVAVVTAVTA